MHMVSHLTDLACPKNISSFWGGGFLLGACLGLQLVTGLFLALFYTTGEANAFISTMYIMRDVSGGWLVQAMHANGATLFFAVLYVHMGRGLYYKSYNLIHVWSAGVTLFFLLILTAFLGYVLPWGQMSFWAATVITGLCTAIPVVGVVLTQWLWGGFSVSDSTLVRFYALHFLLPFVISLISIVHVLFLHEGWSNNPLGVSTIKDSIKFHPYFTFKDAMFLVVVVVVYFFVVFFNPRMFVDPENFIPANPLVTPVHIQPEWYFLPMYAILRSIPNKLGGVVGLVMSIGVLYLCPLLYSVKLTNRKVIFWWFVCVFVLLGWIGSMTVAYPYSQIGVVFTILYFVLFFVLVGWRWQVNLKFTKAL